MKIPNYNGIKFDFFDTAVADILRAVDGGASMGSFILSMCCIDYMGMGINPYKKENTSVDFKRFVVDYMGKVNPRYNAIKEELWAVRNSVIHVYGASHSAKRMNNGFQVSNRLPYPENHLQIIHDQLLFNLPEFHSEVIAAIELFFRQYKGDLKHLRAWYSKLLIMESADVGFERLRISGGGQPSYKRSHKCLDVLDSDPPRSIDEIKRSICGQLTKRLR